LHCLLIHRLLFSFSSLSGLVLLGRFAEAMSSRRKANALLAMQGGGRRRSSSFRDRSNSDAVAPWPEVNGDITCEHGNLRPLSHKGLGGSGSGSGGGGGGGMGGKRRVVDKKAWRAVRRFYGLAKPFRTSSSPECPLCLHRESAEKQRLESEKKAREQELHAHPALLRLFDRRTGT
jgi:hypothetical protein